MKNFVKLFGIAVVVAVIGLSNVSCKQAVGAASGGLIDTDNYTGTGTINVVNNSSSSTYDYSVTVRLYRGSGTGNLASTVTGVGQGQYAYFRNVPSGYNYWVRVTDRAGSGSNYDSSTYYLSSGDTLNFSYSGLGVSRQY